MNFSKSTPLPLCLLPAVFLLWDHTCIFAMIEQEGSKRNLNSLNQISPAVLNPLKLLHLSCCCSTVTPSGFSVSSIWNHGENMSYKLATGIMSDFSINVANISK